MEMDPYQILKARVGEFATQRAAAKALRISAPYLTDLLKRRRALSPRMLKKLGLRNVVMPIGESR